MALNGGGHRHFDLGHRCQRIFFLRNLSVTVQSEARQDSQGRQVQQPLHLVGSLERLVQMFLQEGHSHAERQTHHKAQNQVQKDARLRWPLRYFGCIHDADVAGFQPRRDLRLLHALQQTLI